MFSACAKLDPPKLSLWAAYINSMVNAFVVTPLAFQTGFHAAGTGFAESNLASQEVRRQQARDTADHVAACLL